MARKKYLLALSLTFAAIAPAALVGCGGSPATPTLSGSAPSGAASPTTVVGTPSGATSTMTGTAPGGVPTMTGSAPLPQGTGVAPAAVPTTQP